MNKSIELIYRVMGNLHFPHNDSSIVNPDINLREITLSSGKPAVFWIGDEVFFTDKHKKIFTKNPHDAAVVADEHIESLLSEITDSSPYLYENSISEGYIPFYNGIRVSVAGDGYTNPGNNPVFRKINTISFRISRRLNNISSECFEYISDRKTIYNTLIVSPPCCGKTTLLRDIACALARRFRTGIADERNEICIGDMGLHSVIVRGIPKQNAFDMFIRNASCDVIVCDEIGGSGDAHLIYEASKRGVSVIATLHGRTYSDLCENPLSENIYPLFDTIIILSDKKGAGEINEIYFRGEKHCFT